VQKIKRNIPIVVIDTNVLISYLFGGATITSIIDAVERDVFVPALSPFLEKEFLDTIKRPRIARHVNILQAVAFMEEWKNFAEYAVPHHIVAACRDKEDNEVLACALEVGASFVVTGDNDLLVLKEFEGILIQSPTDFARNTIKM
jgi:hypothetical protein